MDLKVIFIILILILIYQIYLKKETFIRSVIDSRAYQVKEQYHDKERAADLLAIINQRNLTFIQYIDKKYKGTMGRGADIAKRLKSRYDPNNLRENLPRTSNFSDTSYTEDKGKVIALCLRDKEQKKLHDLNILMFVSLHELAHIATIEYDHGIHFWNNFKFMLQDAVALGVYTPVDYRKNPINYCGLDVNDNPLFNL
jgi:hypothetical protein